MITALSKYTVQNMLDKFNWGNLTTAQKISILNSAQEEIVTFVNEYTDRKDYIHDIVAAADDLLSPSAAGNEASFEDYLEIIFDAYDGTAEVVTANTDTNVGELTFDDPPTIDISGTLAVYTITITGSTFADGRLYFEPPYPGLVSFELVSATSFKIHVAKSHTPFSIVLKKRKLT